MVFLGRNTFLTGALATGSVSAFFRREAKSDPCEAGCSNSLSRSDLNAFDDKQLNQMYENLYQTNQSLLKKVEQKKEELNQTIKKHKEEMDEMDQSTTNLEAEAGEKSEDGFKVPYVPGTEQLKMRNKKYQDGMAEVSKVRTSISSEIAKFPCGKCRSLLETDARLTMEAAMKGNREETINQAEKLDHENSLLEETLEKIQGTIDREKRRYDRKKTFMASLAKDAKDSANGAATKVEKEEAAFERKVAQVEQDIKDRDQDIAKIEELKVKLEGEYSKLKGVNGKCGCV